VAFLTWLSSANRRRQWRSVNGTEIVSLTANVRVVRVRHGSICVASQSSAHARIDADEPAPPTFRYDADSAWQWLS
jgi:hypothetical protein